MWIHLVGGGCDILSSGLVDGGPTESACPLPQPLVCRPLFRGHVPLEPELRQARLCFRQVGIWLLRGLCLTGRLPLTSMGLGGESPFSRCGFPLHCWYPFWSAHFHLFILWVSPSLFFFFFFFFFRCCLGLRRARDLLWIPRAPFGVFYALLSPPGCPRRDGWLFSPLFRLALGLALRPRVREPLHATVDLNGPFKVEGGGSIPLSVAP